MLLKISLSGFLDFLEIADSFDADLPFVASIAGILLPVTSKAISFLTYYLLGSTTPVSFFTSGI